MPSHETRRSKAARHRRHCCRCCCTSPPHAAAAVDAAATLRAIATPSRHVHWPSRRGNRLKRLSAALKRRLRGSALPLLLPGEPRTKTTPHKSRSLLHCHSCLLLHQHHHTSIQQCAQKHAHRAQKHHCTRTCSLGRMGRPPAGPAWSLVDRLSRSAISARAASETARCCIAAASRSLSPERARLGRGAAAGRREATPAEVKGAALRAARVCMLKNVDPVCAVVQTTGNGCCFAKRVRL